MRACLGLLLLAVLAAPVSAQLDPGPDGVGIYFDEAANQVTASAPAPGPGEAPVLVPAYLVATNPGFEGEAGYWAATVATLPPSGGPETSEPAAIFGSPTVAFNLVTANMPGGPSWSFLGFLGTAEHLPLQPATVLAELSVLVGSSAPVRLYVWEAELAARDGPTVGLHPSSGAWELPVAVINGPAPVRAATATWGAVKRLFK